MDQKVVLLDLDGTLLPIDIDKFLKGYFHLLGKEFSDLFEAEVFIDSLMKATYKMIANKGEAVNQDVFKKAFFHLLDYSDDQQLIMDRFDRFYQDVFPSLKEGIIVDQKPVRLIKILKEKGLRLALATNPLFPQIAIYERMNWANLNPDDFALITTYENMHYCKPNPAYYLEIANRMGAEAADCMMIGNDVQEDMVAGKLGMKTFLLTDYLINREDEEIDVDWQGNLEQLIDYFNREL